jgi:hypothetical protein
MSRLLVNTDQLFEIVNESDQSAYAVIVPVEEIARSHLALGPIVDRRFYRFDQRQASGLARVGKDVLGAIAFKARFSERRQKGRGFGLGIVPGGARGHDAMTTRSAVACNIAIPWGGATTSYSIKSRPAPDPWKNKPAMEPPDSST